MESSSVVSLNLCMPLAAVHISFGSASANSSGCFPDQSNAAGEEDIFLSASNLCACVCMCAFLYVWACLRACLMKGKNRASDGQCHLKLLGLFCT